MRVNHPPKVRFPSAEPELMFMLRRLDRKRPETNKQHSEANGWSHNLPLDWRQAGGNVVIYRYGATKLKENIQCFSDKYCPLPCFIYIIVIGKI